ncbi:MAG: hypothetical protein ASARMPREDX12_001692 [Alectoria sarmentosa]|nr:MAG: hypothetical protein ASARMPREDX12_001692 [Alectoria sarmentosa]
MLTPVDAFCPAKVQTRPSTEPKASKSKDRYDIPISKQINYIWLGPTFDNFDQNEIQECVKRNPDYRVRLWLDDFSMLEIEGPCGLPSILPPASLKIYTSGMNKAISSAQINKTFAVIVRAQIEYYKVRLKSQLRAHIPTIQKFQDFLQQNNLHNVDLLFLSDFYEALFQAEHQRDQKSLCYPSLNPSSLASRWDNLGPEVRLLQWAFFERYRGNYAAASNLLRAQLLQTHPGIYVDHHTTVPSIGNITGFRFGLTADLTASQSFLASAPNHPCLQYFRYCILQNYDVLLKNDFKCMTLDYTTMKKPTDPLDLQNPYISETYSMSGPGAFFKAMKDVAEGVLGENIDISKAAMEKVWVNARVMKG